MKLIKTASKTKLKLSRKEWEKIGKKAGWVKEAQNLLRDQQAYEGGYDSSPFSMFPEDEEHEQAQINSAEARALMVAFREELQKLTDLGLIDSQEAVLFNIHLDQKIEAIGR